MLTFSHSAHQLTLDHALLLRLPTVVLCSGSSSLNRMNLGETCTGPGSRLKAISHGILRSGYLRESWSKLGWWGGPRLQVSSSPASPHRGLIYRQKLKTKRAEQGYALVKGICYNLDIVIEINGFKLR